MLQLFTLFKIGPSIPLFNSIQKFGFCKFQPSSNITSFGGGKEGREGGREGKGGGRSRRSLGEPVQDRMMFSLGGALVENRFFFMIRALSCLMLPSMLLTCRSFFSCSLFSEEYGSLLHCSTSWHSLVYPQIWSTQMWMEVKNLQTKRINNICDEFCGSCQTYSIKTMSNLTYSRTSHKRTPSGPHQSVRLREVAYHHANNGTTRLD